MIPELVGRLPVVSPLTPLDDDDAGPRADRAEERPGQAVPGAVRAWKNAELEFTDEAPAGDRRARPIEKDTGARGLRSIVEEVMLDIMFELPDQTEQTKYLITDDIVFGRGELFPLPEPKHKSA